MKLETNHLTHKLVSLFFLGWIPLLLLYQWSFWPVLILSPVVCSSLYLSLLPISRHHTVFTVYAHFILLVAIKLFAWYFWRRLENATKQPKKIQDKTLKKILQFNAQTEYGKLFNFSSVSSSEDFINRHPLTNYDYYRDFVDRIIEGLIAFIAKFK